MTLPSSTYRLQLGPDLSFADAITVVPYLASLGVGAVYTSPLLQAMPGSQHGYDVADPGRVSDVIGGEPGRRALAAAVREHRLALVVDIVPNHLGVADPQANPAWWDLLQHGPASRFARWFDITGWPLRLPILADSPDALSDLRVDGGLLRYHERAFPLAPGTAEAGSPLEVHEAQHYRLVSWRADLGYRRFFAVSELAAVRVEDPDVFAATHCEVLRWVTGGDVDGLRVDHPDGLTDPADYLHRLREHAPDAWILVEKILEPGEELPSSWPVEGTTGYDALAEVDGVLVDPAGEAAFTALDTELTGVRTEWAQLVQDCKLDVATGMLNSELRRLAGLVLDMTDVSAVSAALAELLACFPVYRSYLPDGVEHLDQALAAARNRRPDLDVTLEALSPRLRDPGDELAVRFQQTSGAVTAKGVEDTAYYRWTRFVALNEVGGDPARFGLEVDGFHAALAHREQIAPHGMTTLSTHDTKRSGDVRARLAVLSELPALWVDSVREFSRLADAAGATVPDPALGHLLWQTLVGAWPLPPERLHAYLEKAMREARTRTSWTDPDEAFETAMHAVADAALENPALSAAVARVAVRIISAGRSNSLSAVLLQLAMPGIPDTYQGGELWDLSLVDPDNRRPVNFTARAGLLRQIDEGWLPGISGPDGHGADLHDAGAAKLLVVSRTLRARRDHPERFTGYRPLRADGVAAPHAVAFARHGVVAVATRLPIGLAALGGWGETALPLPDGSWTDAFTGFSASGRVPLVGLLARYPVALLLAD
ncbi:MAG TPA: malto-oligosyltrehalose synthase [Pseudonocardiaceae bacterium]|nr:malto-oligosyltrehalose synthase [Pseudonocardiaceae bacterium]